MWIGFGEWTWPCSQSVPTAVVGKQDYKLFLLVPFVLFFQFVCTLIFHFYWRIAFWGIRLHKKARKRPWWIRSVHHPGSMHADAFPIVPVMTISKGIMETKRQVQWTHWLAVIIGGDWPRTWPGSLCCHRSLPCVHARSGSIQATNQPLAALFRFNLVDDMQGWSHFCLLMLSIHYDDMSRRVCVCLICVCSTFVSSSKSKLVGQTNGNLVGWLTDWMN